MSSSVYDELSRVRKPRVHITYEVETEGATLQKELPFVVGVLGDFSGDPTQPLKPLKERKFVEIDRDSFDAIMSKMQVGLNLQVPNTLKNDGSTTGVNLVFNAMEDFEPGKIVLQIPALTALLNTRNQLRDLLTKIDRSDDLAALLEGALQNKDQVQQLAQQLGIASTNGQADGAAAATNNATPTQE